MSATLMSATLMSPTMTNAATPSPVTSRLNDALTLADTCLYMLETSGNSDQPDCDRLMAWHAQQWPALRNELGELTAAAALSTRDSDTVRQYQQTLTHIDKWHKQRRGEALP
jgi:hypothetical protein